MRAGTRTGAVRTRAITAGTREAETGSSAALVWLAGEAHEAPQG